MILKNFTQKLRPYVPLTALNTVWRHLDKSGQSILDVGCGKGEVMKFINRHRKFHAIGVDIFEPYLQECQKLSCYDNIILADVRTLPFESKSFDIVLCMEVLEHLEKDDGEKLLHELDRVARRQILLSTPVSKYEQHTLDGNPDQEHKFIWHADELRQRGYRVKGMGIKGLPREELNSGFLLLMREILYVLGGLFSYNFPGIACHIVADKKPEYPKNAKSGATP